MSASPQQKFTAFETEPDDFEEVALLLEPDQQQGSNQGPLSWKDRLLQYFAWGGARSHTGFEKLDQTENAQEGSHRRQGVDVCHIKQQQTIQCLVFHCHAVQLPNLMQCITPVILLTSTWLALKHLLCVWLCCSWRVLSYQICIALPVSTY